ncbi:BrnT family toxin [Sphingomonas sp. CV7422]|uniref:BrnT family toxin n=1 Tax=Sphingomonas sp. CV7422 TaxID=3018036 RepID=UPI0022FE0F40|nr:BrnT family toxin [Sphingomonas sp. CV7422]
MLVFEFDPAKAALNVAKHGVSFELAQAVWGDPLHVILVDRVVGGECRYHAIGMVGHVLLLVVVHSYPDGVEHDRIRIIGARRATRHERKRYEEEA